ncbi:hypothetical protein ACXR2U_08070 [Jatrophihabitans sp. YIM 134969]
MSVTGRVARVLAPLVLVGAALTAAPLGAPAAAAAPHPDGVGRYVALTPFRVLDTRGGGAVAQGGTAVVDFSGRLPDRVVSAVVVNVTVVNATKAGYITAYPAGATRPLASSLSHRAGETRANSVTVALPASASNQKVALYNSAGSTDLIVDLYGYYVGDAADPATASSYYPLSNPVRVLDSRSLGAGGALGPGAVRTVQRAFVRPGGGNYAGVRAVAVTITAVNPRGSGYLRAWDGDPDNVPTVSTLNFARGQTIPNFAIVPTRCVNPPTCSTFSFAVSNNVSPATDVLVDIVGIYGPNGQPGGLYFTPITPRRVVDTRIPQGFGRLGPGATGAAAVTGFSSPQVANVNLTSVSPTVATYLTIYADGKPRPTASNLNPIASETAADAAQPLLTSGRFRVYNANGSTQVIVDVTGAFQLD